MNQGTSYRARRLADALEFGPNSTVAIVFGYSAALGVAEVTALVGVAPGMLLFALILLAALLHFGLAPNAPVARVLPIFALISLLRVLSLALPLPGFSPIFLNLLVVIPLLVGIWLTVRLIGWAPRDLGLTSSRFLPQFLIALSGSAFGLVIYFVLTPPSRQFPNPWMVMVATIALVLAGFVEELLFRGMLSRSLTQLVGRSGLVLGSLLFGVMYLGAFSPALVIAMAGIGFLFGLLLNRTHCLWGVGFAHGLMNVTAFIVLPVLLPLARG